MLENQGDDVSHIQKRHHRCHRKTHITILAGRIFPGEVQQLSRQLRRPCYKFFVFVHGIRKVIPWNRHLSVDNKLNFPGNETVEDINIIKNYHHEVDHHVKKILIVLQYRIFEERNWNALARLEKEPHWKVILTCQKFYCPPKGTIPLNRVVPTPIWTNQLLPKISTVIVDLVKNPRYDLFEFYKHVTIHDSRMKCLRNKTVHIIVESLSLQLAESLVIIRHNLKEIPVNIVIYSFLNNYWQSFFEKHKLDRGKFRIVEIDILIPLQKSFDRESKDIYLQEETNDFDISLMCAKKPINGRKSMVIYPSATESRRSGWTKACPNKVELFSIKNINYIYQEKYFIAEMLRSACF